MKKSPKISIIIPVYDVEPYIAECLQSVMRQTYTGEIECILVDDCGKDNSIAIAEHLIADYNGSIQFRILRHEHNRGLSAARNTGTDASEGDYIYYLDSDDYISDDCIAVLVQPLQEYDYDMVIGDVRAFGINDRNVSGLKISEGAVKSNSEIIRQVYIYQNLYFSAWNKLWKKDLSKTNDLSFLEGQLEEDLLWTYKCCRSLKSIYIVNRITYHYRSREGSIMDVAEQNKAKHRQSAYDTLNYVLSHPFLTDKALWEHVAARFLKEYLAVFTHGRHEYLNQYIFLRKRFDYQPLRAWIRGEIMTRELKPLLFLVLPPRMGYMFIRIRYWKNQILSSEAY